MKNIDWTKWKTVPVEVARPLSKGDMAIIACLRAGFAASEDGGVIKPDGSHQLECINNDGYKIFRTPSRVGHPSTCVLSHRFCAAFFFGELALSAYCVRHLNDCKTDNARRNLRPGTASENRQDIDPSIRKNACRIAREIGFMSVINANRKLSDAQVIEICAKRLETGMDYESLGKLFGIGPNAARMACTGRTFKHIARKTVARQNSDSRKRLEGGR